jgi:hypothetical protein
MEGTTMKTYKDRMKSYIILLIMFAVGFILMSLSLPKAHGAVDSAPGFVVLAKMAKFDAAMQKAIERANKISIKHYGFKTVHSVSIAKGTFTIDINSEALKASKLSWPAQVNYMIDSITSGNEQQLSNIGIRKIVVQVDGGLFKEFDLKGVK